MDNLIRVGFIIIIVGVFSVLLVYLLSRVASMGYFKTREDYDHKRNQTTNKKGQ